MLTIKAVTPEDIIKIKREIQLEGASVTSPNGISPNFSINGHHIIAACFYDSAKQELLVDIKSKPFWLPAEAIYHSLKDRLITIDPTIEVQSTEGTADASKSEVKE